MGLLFIKDFNSGVKKFGVPLGKKLAYLRNFHVCKFKKFSNFFLFLKDISRHFKDIWRHLKKNKKKFHKKISILMYIFDGHFEDGLDICWTSGYVHKKE